MSRFSSFRVALGVLGCFCCAGLYLLQLVAIADLFPFEWRPLVSLLGLKGIVSIVVLNFGVALVLYASMKLVRRSPFRKPAATAIVAVASAATALWAAQFMFLENPPSIRLNPAFRNPPETVLPPALEKDFATFSLALQAPDDTARQRLRTMYARIWINAPAVFERNPIGQTIDRVSARYQIEPSFLFFRSYLISYFGQATSGPVPFLGMMTTETIDDVIQVHLPAWFVESSVRQHLISSNLLERAFGQRFGSRLRYALHKATLDVSTSPYDINTFTDTLLVLREFPEQFPEMSAQQPTDPLWRALRQSFLAIKEDALLPPYGEPYRVSAYDEAYYESKRNDLKRFARAAYYLTILDFDFATRQQALLSSYQREIYKHAVGTERWNAIPRYQQIAMLVMVRDLYSPNVGHLSYNLYSLPELNCAGVEFVASEATRSPSLPGPTQHTVWRPQHYEHLLSASGYQLTVFNEVWTSIGQDPIPGIKTNNTAAAARRIVGLNSPLTPSGPSS